MLYPESTSTRMSDGVLEMMIARFMALPMSQYSFCWQGGEPTLMGVDFYRRVVELQKKYGRAGSSVANALQTNGTLIDDTFAKHLAEYNFLVGVSLDGTEDIHDKFRRYPDGRGSFKKVMKAIDCLRRNGVAFNILTLVTSANVRRSRDVYRFLRDEGLFYHQYIPCVEFDEKGRPLPFSVGAEAWGDFLSGIFDEWVRGDVRKISVRLFDSIMARLLTGRPSMCSMDTNCCQYFVVEHNGDVYPCDFFVNADLKLGNATSGQWCDFLASPGYRSFGEQKSKWNMQCGKCAYVDFCAGDCPKHRFYQGNNPEHLSFLCTGWQRFYEHSLGEFKRIAVSVQEEEAQRQQMSAHQSPTGMF